MAEVITRSLARVHRPGATAPRWATTSRCAAPARAPGTRANRCTSWLRGAGPGRLSPITATSRTSSCPPSSAQIDLVVALDRRHQQTLRGLGADPDRLGPAQALRPRRGRRRRRARSLLRRRRRLRRLPRHDRRRPASGLVASLPTTGTRSGPPSRSTQAASRSAKRLVSEPSRRVQPPEPCDIVPRGLTQGHAAAAPIRGRRGTPPPPPDLLRLLLGRFGQAASRSSPPPSTTPSPRPSTSPRTHRSTPTGRAAARP